MPTRPRPPSAPAKRAPATPSPSRDDGAVLAQLAALRQEMSALREEVRAMTRRPQSRRPSLDPGDAVPPGVAVQEPEPLRAEDKKALRSLERLPKRSR